MTAAEEIRKELIEKAEESYKAFNSRILPGVENILGVRVPELRKLAKKLCKGKWEEYLMEKPSLYYEEYVVRALLIGMADMKWESRFSWIREFVPELGNWGVTDAFCSGLKAVKEHRQEMWQYICECFESAEEYTVRFAIVMMLDHYVDDEYIRKQLELLNRFSHPDYYARMAAAWAISICYREYPEITMEYLKHSPLDDWTYNKALQKIMESLKTGQQEKKEIAGMKRKSRDF